MAATSVLALAFTLTGAPPVHTTEAHSDPSFTVPLTIAPPFGRHTALTGAMDASGAVTLVWNTAVGEAHTVQITTIPPGSTEAGPVRALSGINLRNSPPALDEDPSGQTAIAWFDERETQTVDGPELIALQVRNQLPDGRLEQLQTVWHPAHRAEYSFWGPICLPGPI